MMPHFSTKERILTAAEELFAVAGFHATSLRQITSAANVNVASVNYHFGSKESLVNAVFKRRLDELTEQRITALQLAQKELCLEKIMQAFVMPALEMANTHKNGSLFMRVLARAYAEHDKNLRQFLSDNYGHVLKQFAKAIQELLPQIEKETLYWRLDFIAGALAYAMSDFGMVKRPAGRSEATHRRVAADAFVKFAVAGLRASS